MKNDEDNIKLLEMFSKKDYSHCPIYQVSNKDGTNIELLKNFLFTLQGRFDEMEPESGDKNVFKIYDKFNVVGIGLVVSGYVRRGEIVPGQKMYMGPVHGDWKEVIIKSLHDNFRTSIGKLTTGESGCINIKFTDKKFKIHKKSIKKGAVISSMPKLFSRFEADIFVLSSHSTTIKENYQPILNCNTIVQSAKIYDFEEGKKVIRGGQKARVKFQFMYRGEYFEKGDLFIFREGNLRGLGKIIQVIES